MDFITNAIESQKDEIETVSLLEFLHYNGVDYHATDNDGRNTLHYTFQSCILEQYRRADEDVLTAVYKFLIETVDVNCLLADRNGINPLMLAQKNHAESACVSKLINRDVPKQSDNNGAKNLDLDCSVLEEVQKCSNPMSKSVPYMPQQMQTQLRLPPFTSLPNYSLFGGCHPPESESESESLTSDTSTDIDSPGSTNERTSP